MEEVLTRWLPFLSPNRHIKTLTDRVKVLRPTRHKIGHFGDVLPSQCLGLELRN